jgi:hypothetical protein
MSKLLDLVKEQHHDQRQKQIAAYYDFLFNTNLDKPTAADAKAFNEHLKALGKQPIDAERDLKLIADIRIRLTAIEETSGAEQSYQDADAKHLAEVAEQRVQHQAMRERLLAIVAIKQTADAAISRRADATRYLKELEAADALLHSVVTAPPQNLKGK